MATGAAARVGRLAGGNPWDCGADIGSRRGLGRMRRESIPAAWIAAGEFRGPGEMHPTEVVPDPGNPVSPHYQLGLLRSVAGEPGLRKQASRFPLGRRKVRGGANRSQSKKFSLNHSEVRIV
jgi:hypothetical protein